ncbi:MAG TPA: MazG-like family protein [Desulfobacteria bacterium]|nr:MazG-like family protein [Desulfobacteria bacterium]
MSVFNQGTDIARNIKVIEWLKTELIGTVSAVFKAMLKNSEEAIEDALASMVVTIYVLARRLGINFSQLDVRVEGKVRNGIKEKHEIEDWYGDLTALLKYLSDKKR